MAPAGDYRLKSGDSQYGDDRRTSHARGRSSPGWASLHSDRCVRHRPAAGHVQRVRSDPRSPDAARSRWPTARRTSARPSQIAGPVMIIGWVAIIFLMGGYRPEVFGAGLDEYKRVVNGSLITAAAVGIGCYLLEFQLARGFFVLAFAIGIPVLVLGRLVLRRSVQRARRLRLPPAPRGHRRRRGSRRRDRRRPRSRDLARLQRGRRPHPGARRARRRPTPASRCSAPRTRSPRWPSTPRPTSSSSPVARSAPPTRCASWPGTSSTRTSRS